MPPLPERKPSILVGVSDEEIKSEIGNHEGVVDYLYKDTGRNGGFVTVGYGRKIVNIEEAKKLPFDIKDKTGEYRKATAEEIERAFRKIDILKNDNNAANAFKPSEGSLARKYNLDDLRLPEKEARKLLDKDLRDHVRILRQKFKNRMADFDTLSPPLQKLLLDIQFNTGMDLSEWKNLDDAIKEQNWEKLKQEIIRPQIGEARKKWVEEQINSDSPQSRKR